MDTFENNNYTGDESCRPTDHQEPVADGQPVPPIQEPTTPYQSGPQSAPYSGAGAGRRESPYANSPYVSNSQPNYQYQYQPQTQPPQKPPRQKKPRSGHTGRRVLAAVLVLALVVSGCLVTAYSVNARWEKRSQETEAALSQRIAALEAQSNSSASSGSSGLSRPVSGSSGLTPAALYDACVDSVVAISTTVTAPGLYGIAEGTSSGSGFILSAEGYVVTNYHVVENASSISVILHDGSEHPAEEVGHDASNDIAVLKLTETVDGLKAATIGSSASLAIGDMVVAIGNPLGELASTQTVGYVSGINREVTTDNTILSMLQTDAAINPGNSGGPLFNMNGEVIGITTAKYSGTTGSGASIEGIGFAIPIDDVRGMIGDLVDFGYVTGAYLGVTVQDMDAESVSRYGLPNGAYVVTVVDDGSADRAGIHPKDIITALGEYKVTSVTELTRSLRNFKANDETTVTVVRGGQELTLNITLDEKPRDPGATAPTDDPSMPNSGNYDEWYDYFRRYFGG